MTGELGFSPDYQIAIIGAGPAGLFCAERLLENGFSAAGIAIFDAGRPAEERLCPASSSTQPEPCVDRCAQLCDVLQGEGGPGFWIDCKLCIDKTAGAKELLTANPRYFDLVEFVDRQIYETLRREDFGTTRQWAGERNAEFYRSLYAEHDLEFHTYPVRPLGTDGARKYLAASARKLKAAGVSFFFRSELTEVEFGGADFRLRFETPFRPSSVHVKKVLLAVGRSGAALAERIAAEQGVEIQINNLDLGVRIEFPRSVGTDLWASGANPKVKSYSGDGSTYAKTHCFCYGGEVISYRYAGIHLVDGHASHAHDSPNSNVNLLYRYRFEPGVDPLRMFQRATEMVNDSAGGKIVCQRLGDFMNGKASTFPDLSYSLQPTLRPDAYTGGRIDDWFPNAAVQGIKTLIQRLGRVLPGFDDAQNLLYAPAAEWTMKQIRVGPNMEAGIPGFYIAGDCAGITQGVLAAAVSGIVAADALAN